MTSVNSVLIEITVSQSNSDANKFKLFGELDDIVGVFANYIQVATFVIPAVGFAVDLVRSMWNGGAADHDPVLNAIQHELDTLLQAQAGSSAHEEMLTITTVLGPAKQRFKTLLAFGPGDPQVSLEGTVQDTGNAVGVLLQPAYWFRQYFPQLVYGGGDPQSYDWWIPGFVRTSPPTGGEVRPDVDATSFANYAQVFDHRLALPACCEALTILHAAIAILRPSDYANAAFLADCRRQLRSFANYLSKAMDGLHLVRLPVEAEATKSERDENVTGYMPVLPGDWLWQRSFGVVDIYTSDSLLGSYGKVHGPPWMVYAPGSGTYDELAARLELGRLTRLKALHIARGFNEAWTLLQSLRRALEPEAVESVDRRATWSLREIDQALGHVYPDDPQNPSLVWVTARGTTRRLLLLAGRAPDGPTSLRAALDAAAP